MEQQVLDLDQELASPSDCEHPQDIAVASGRFAICGVCGALGVHSGRQVEWLEACSR